MFPAGRPPRSWSTICAGSIELSALKTYFDTSVLLKSYIPEAQTPEALAIIRAAGGPFPLSHLLELELRTAIRIKHGRGEITAAEKLGALQALEKDIAAGVLVRPDCDVEEVFRRAEAISSKHAASTLARSADLWHIAAAIESGCTAFASFDERQRKVAALCGLPLIPARVGKDRVMRVGKQTKGRT